MEEQLTKRKGGSTGKHWTLSAESRKNISEGCKAHGVGKWMKGRKGHFSGWNHTEIVRKNMSESRKGRHAGSKHPNWVVDRSKLKTGERPYDTKYKYWMWAVKKRDNWKCKIGNSDCKGRLEAHHILTWDKFPELRYVLENGITLCSHHHPRTRDGEIKWAQHFQELIKTYV